MILGATIVLIQILAYRDNSRPGMHSELAVCGLSFSPSGKFVLHPIFQWTLGGGGGGWGSGGPKWPLKAKEF